MSEFITVLLMLIGSIISVISAVGIIRFPDVYTRSHAATKSSTLAVLLTLVGAFLYFLFTESLVSIRLILGIVFVFLTSPVAGHLIIRAAYRSGVKLSDSTVEDELKDVLHSKDSEQNRASEVSSEQEPIRP
ncbi:Na+/H+ antiporter subunit G [Lederbergia galactosidilytica]|nr:Na+/H+ antiporter subunit G [Lederbergia galactosidilytica]